MDYHLNDCPLFMFQLINNQWHHDLLPPIIRSVTKYTNSTVVLVWWFCKKLYLTIIGNGCDLTNQNYIVMCTHTMSYFLVILIVLSNFMDEFTKKVKQYIQNRTHIPAIIWHSYYHFPWQSNVTLGRLSLIPVTPFANVNSFKNTGPKSNHLATGLWPQLRNREKWSGHLFL